MQVLSYLGNLVAFSQPVRTGFRISSRSFTNTVARLSPYQDLPLKVQILFDEAKDNFNEKAYDNSLRKIAQIQECHRAHKSDPDILRLRAEILCKRHELGRFPGVGGTLFFPKFSSPEIQDSPEQHPSEEAEPQPSVEDIKNQIFVSGFADDELLLLQLSRPLSQDFSPVIEERVQLNEGVAEKKYYKGIAHYISGEWEKAQSTFQEISTTIPEAKLKEGHSFLLLGEPKKAIQAYKIALKKVNTAKSEALAGIACAYLELGLPTKAGKAFQRSCIEGDRDTTANNVLAWLAYRLPQLLFTAERTTAEPLCFDSHFEFRKLFLDLNRPTDVSVRKKPRKELAYAQKLLNKIGEVVTNPELRQLFVAEVLSKIVGFQDYTRLSAAERKITIPYNDALVDYKIEKIRLPHNVFAVGLIPIEKDKYPPVLIFRGTSTKMSSPGAVVSMYMNIDPKGVAKTLFEESDSIILQWLTSAHKQTGNKVQLVGYSQGAALVAMTATSFPTLIQDSPEFPSITLNAAASDQTTAENWEKIDAKPCLKQYLVKSDIVCRLGYELIGDLYEIQYNVLSAGIRPHFILTFAQPGWKCFRVDKQKDRIALSRKMISILASSDLGRELFSHFSEGYLGMIFRAANKAGTILNSEEASKFFNYVTPFAPLLFRGGTLATGYMVNALGEVVKSITRR